MSENPISEGGSSERGPSSPKLSLEAVLAASADGALRAGVDAEKADLRKECEELRKRLAAVPRATQNAALRISELEKALLSIRQARDTTLSEVHIVKERLVVAEERVEELKGEIEPLEQALEAQRNENAGLRELLKTLESTHENELSAMRAKNHKAGPPTGGKNPENSQHAELAAARERIRELEARMEALEARSQKDLAEMEGRLAAGKAAGDGQMAEQLAGAMRKLAAMDAYFEKTQEQQKQANSAMVERLVKANQQKRTAEEAAAEAQKKAERIAGEYAQAMRRLEEAQAEVAALRNSAPPRDGQEASRELAEQREQLANLSAQLDTTRDELRVAWAVKAGAAESPAAEAAAAAAPDGTGEILTPLEGRAAMDAVAWMSATLDAATSAEEPGEALGLLDAQLQGFAQRTLCAGSMATYRLVGVCSEVVQWVQKSPVKLASARAILHESFDLLSLLAAKSGEVEADTNDTAVYVIDDDLDNCECIAMALDKIGLRIRYAANPELALKHLAANPYELIILDVDLGSSNGFEVRTRIRQIPHFEHTPVLFCSALTSAKQKAEELEASEVGFLEKPYTLSVLGLKVLGMILRSRIAAG